MCALLHNPVLACDPGTKPSREITVTTRDSVPPDSSCLLFDVMVNRKGVCMNLLKKKKHIAT